MERVQQVYKVMLLEETYLLSAKEFDQFQMECREIAEYGEPVLYQVPTYETVVEQLESSAEQALEEVQPQLTYDYVSHQPIANTIEIEAADDGLKVIAKPIQVHNDKLKDLINTMPKTAKIAKDTKIQKYVKMHEAGVDMIAIKNSMIKDKVCAESSIPYFVKKILAVSNKVTKVVEHVGRTDDQIIEELIQKNKDKAADRQKPRLAMK